MKRGRFSAKQKMTIRCAGNAESTVKEVCAKRNIRESIYYASRRLRTLEDENARLKR